eukprot:2816774-Amphidinium_carterae.2
MSPALKISTMSKNGYDYCDDDCSYCGCHMSTCPETARQCVSVSHIDNTSEKGCSRRVPCQSSA